MREYRYIITFENGVTTYVSAFNKEEAEILAKAVMIKRGLCHDIALVRKATDKEYQMYESIDCVDESDGLEKGPAGLSNFSDRELLDELERRMQR